MGVTSRSNISESNISWCNISECLINRCNFTLYNIRVCNTSGFINTLVGVKIICIKYFGVILVYVTLWV